MKRLTAIAILLIMLAQTLCVFADETQSEQTIPERVEISFRVGDETLMINGSPVTVEKPYVVGVGVTLVPLRVITEAFGAKVEWIAETKSIDLTYPDVKILLQINNPIAEVNGKAQELLSAPELTPTGFTMVPLRFISETFGAQVSYDDATKSITVIKETANEGDMVEVGSDEKYIGDSIDGWVLANSSDLSVTNREFDGSYTEFDYKGCIIEVYIDKKAEDYNFDKTFNYYKKYYSTDMTLVKAEKNPDLQTMHFQTRDTEMFLEDRMFVSGEYIYSVVVVCEGQDVALRNEALEMAATFSLTYPKEDVYDLSKAHDGMRVYESEALKYSIDIPADYTITREDGIGNTVLFSSTKEGSIENVSISICSKSEFGSAQEACKKNYDFNLEYFNENLYSSNSIAQKTYGEYESYEYRYDISSHSMTATGRDIYFEIGDYIYSINVTVENNIHGEPLAEKILNSFKAEKLDANEVGILLYDGNDYGEGTYECKGTLWSINVPYSFDSLGESDNGVSLIHKDTQTTVIIETTTVPVTTATTITLNDLSQALKDTYAKQGYVLEYSDNITINGKRFADMLYSVEKEGRKFYFRMLLYYKDGTLFTATTAFSELFYSKKMISEVDTIMNSIVIN